MLIKQALKKASVLSEPGPELPVQSQSGTTITGYDALAPQMLSVMVAKDDKELS